MMFMFFAPHFRAVVHPSRYAPRKTKQEQKRGWVHGSMVGQVFLFVERLAFQNHVLTAASERDHLGPFQRGWVGASDVACTTAKYHAESEG